MKTESEKALRIQTIAFGIQCGALIVQIYCAWRIFHP